MARPGQEILGGLENHAALVQRTLRAGQKVCFPGHIVIMGNVNPGAEVVAGGSIVVLGALRGIAHAGAGGSKEAVIVAFCLQPTQLRIGPYISRPPEGEKEAFPLGPEIAQVKEDVIVIERFPLLKS